MSRENVKKFYDMIKEDTVLSDSLNSLNEKIKLETSDFARLKEIVNENIIPLAKERGLDFTADELLDYANEKYIELDSEDLLDVSGGRMSARNTAIGLASVLFLSMGTGTAINFLSSTPNSTQSILSSSAQSNSNPKNVRTKLKKFEKMEKTSDLRDIEENNSKKKTDEVLKDKHVVLPKMFEKADVSENEKVTEPNSENTKRENDIQKSANYKNGSETSNTVEKFNEIGSEKLSKKSNSSVAFSKESRTNFDIVNVDNSQKEKVISLRREGTLVEAAGTADLAEEKLVIGSEGGSQGQLEQSASEVEKNDEKLQEELKQIRDKVEDLKQKEEKLQEELEQKKEKIKGLEQNEEELQEELKQKEGKIKDLKQEKEKLQEELKQNVGKIKKLEQAIKEDAERENEQLSKNEKLKKIAKQLKDKGEKLEQNLQQAEVENKRLTEELQQKEEKIKKSEERQEGKNPLKIDFIASYGKDESSETQKEETAETVTNNTTKEKNAAGTAELSSQQLDNVESVAHKEGLDAQEALSEGEKGSEGEENVEELTTQDALSENVEQNVEELTTQDALSENVEQNVEELTTKEDLTFEDAFNLEYFDAKEKNITQEFSSEDEKDSVKNENVEELTTQDALDKKAEEAVENIRSEIKKEVEGFFEDENKLNGVELSDALLEELLKAELESLSDKEVSPDISSVDREGATITVTGRAKGIIWGTKEIKAERKLNVRDLLNEINAEWHKKNEEIMEEKGKEKDTTSEKNITDALEGKVEDLKRKFDNAINEVLLEEYNKGKDEDSKVNSVDKISAKDKRRLIIAIEKNKEQVQKDILEKLREEEQGMVEYDDLVVNIKFVPKNGEFVIWVCGNTEERGFLVLSKGVDLNDRFKKFINDAKLPFEIKGKKISDKANCLLKILNEIDSADEIRPENKEAFEKLLNEVADQIEIDSAEKIYLVTEADTSANFNGADLEKILKFAEKEARRVMTKEEITDSVNKKLEDLRKKVEDDFIERINAQNSSLALSESALKEFKQEMFEKYKAEDDYTSENGNGIINIRFKHKITGGAEYEHKMNFNLFKELDRCNKEAREKAIAEIEQQVKDFSTIGKGSIKALLEQKEKDLKTEAKQLIKNRCQGKTDSEFRQEIAKIIDDKEACDKLIVDLKEKFATQKFEKGNEGVLVYKISKVVESDMINIMVAGKTNKGAVTEETMVDLHEVIMKVLKDGLLDYEQYGHFIGMAKSQVQKMWNQIKEAKSIKEFKDPEAVYIDARHLVNQMKADKETGKISLEGGANSGFGNADEEQDALQKIRQFSEEREKMNPTK